MKKNKGILFLILLLTTISACGTVKEGFSSQKKDSTDEFFVEKKAPLVMPPNYGELPIPGDNNLNNGNDENNVKKLITSTEKNKSVTNNPNKSDGSLENSILEKIKN